MKRWLAVLPLLALLGMGVIGTQNLLREDKPAAGLSDGRAAPQIAFDLIDGSGQIKFHEGARGKPVVVNLFASWCGPCEVEHPLLMELARTHPDQTFGVLYRDSAENGQQFLRRLGNPFKAVAHDPDGQGGLDFGLTGVPETFVISAEGQILQHVRGVLTPETIEEIRRLLAGEPEPAPRP
jgi:cytochrome c biogenesis protein CcmG/thiol:disulfide interchange protein DsbE